MIGVNTFALAKFIRQDMSAIYRKIAQIGFDMVEPLVATVDEQGEIPKVVVCKENILPFVDMCEQLGLNLRIAHVAHPSGSVRKLVDYLTWLNEKSGISAFVFGSEMCTAEQAYEQAAFLSEIAFYMKKENCRILYHNHSIEFTPVTLDGITTTVLDCFFQACTEEVLLELDIGWAGIGEDEVAVASRLADRIHSIHLKDFVPGSRKWPIDKPMATEKFSSIGSGEIKTGEVLALRNRFPNFSGNLIIDQDASVGDITEDIKAGYQWLQKMEMKG